MKEELRQRLVELLDDDTKVTEQFAILITAWCHDNPIINKCFGSIADYTELLLPNNILAAGGFVDMLNHTEFITDEDFQSPELIGWLYQFYISERKDEVFAKKGKFEADEIPAATQIFTPNWIVKYMVQNTVGRIYLDNNPYETQLQKKWRYLIYNSECKIYNSGAANTTAQPIINSKLYTINYSSLEELKVADLACGSGHILNECFDLLYDLYIAEGYGRGEAVENIFRHNLTGIDLDTRAKQLSQFALLLKACQKDAAFADAHCLPNVLTMPKPWNEETQGPIQDMFHIYFQGEATNQQKEEIMACFDLMQDADSLGSIMKFDISESTRLLIKQTTDYWCSQEIVPEEVRIQTAAFKLILALTEKYHALVMNPPYMGGGKMNSVLSKYVKDNYEEGKADLFSVFMQMGMERLVDGGKMAQINMQSWMFLSSFEKLRTQFLTHYNIDNMLHLGPRTFDELSGEVVQNTAFVLSKHEPTEQGGVYYRLVEGKNCADKERLFLSHINDNEDGYHIYYPNVEQKNFEKIPGCPIGYWVSEKIFETFTRNRALSDVCKPTQGLATSDNARFLRLWFEPSYSRIGFGYTNAALAARSQKKWFPLLKGGTARKWYGNLEYTINWENNGQEVLAYAAKLYGSPTRTIKNIKHYFKENITWGRIISTTPMFRYTPAGAISETAGCCVFFDNKLDTFTTLGLMNSCILSTFVNVLNPSLCCQSGDIAKIPYKDFSDTTKKGVSQLIQQNISLSKQDWDAHETSWDFQRNELLSIDTSTYTENINYEIEKHFEETGEHICIDPAAPQLGSLEWRMEQYKTKWERKFMQLHKNEEELNRQFIDIYGLQDELTPDVPLNEITILQQGEISIE